MKPSDIYNNSHLLVAGIRVLEHVHQRPPTMDEVCAFLSISLEQGNLICRKLTEIGCLEVVEGSFGIRLFIRDHLKLEDLPKTLTDDTLGKAVRQFQNSRKDIENKIAAIKAGQADKKKSLFAELEKKLKSGLDKKTDRS
jgi:hypothetical protein